MTTINARIKKVRKEAGMNQKEFSESLGVTQSGVSRMEQNGRNVSDMTIKGICNRFNVNESWLRTGKGSTYIQEQTFSLDKFVKDHGGTELELEAFKAYFELDPDIRKMLMKHFKERLAVHGKLAETTVTIDIPAEAAMTKDEAETAYIESCSNFARKTESSALNTTADTENGDFASNQ